MSDSSARVLLTNDDGVDAPGIAALYEELRAVADVTVVAPVENQSGVGRARSRAVDVDAHEWGHAVHSTPADCVAYALRALDTDFDLVVSGCNHGPNCGEYIMGHSGTVGAAVEAAYLGTPALAISAYHREQFFPPEGFTFDVPATLTRLLVEHVLDGGVDLAEADLLSVNAPLDDTGGDLRLTEPLADYGVDVREATDEERERHDGEWRLESDFWARFEYAGRNPSLADVGGSYPAWSDRAAVVAGDVSVSPLRVPQTPVHSEGVDDLVAAVNRAWVAEREDRVAADDD